MKKLTISLLLLFISTSHADVNAAYTRKWIDLKSPFLIERAYNSRSTETGAFGFGWCSNIDRKLTWRRGTRLYLKDCESNQTLTFELFENFLGAKTYREVDHPNDRITLRMGSYHRKRTDGSEQVFDRQGRLIHFTDSAKNDMLLIYDGAGNLAMLADSKGHLATIESKSERITGIQTGERRSTYSYRGADLISVQNEHSSFTFVYDGLHNLTEVAYPDKTREQIFYNTDEDRLIKIVDRRGHATTRDQAAEKIISDFDLQLLRAPAQENQRGPL